MIIRYNNYYNGDDIKGNNNDNNKKNNNDNNNNMMTMIETLVGLCAPPYTTRCMPSVSYYKEVHSVTSAFPRGPCAEA